MGPQTRARSQVWMSQSPAARSHSRHGAHTSHDARDPSSHRSPRVRSISAPSSNRLEDSWDGGMVPAPIPAYPRPYSRPACTAPLHQRSRPAPTQRPYVGPLAQTPSSCLLIYHSLRPYWLPIPSPAPTLSHAAVSGPAIERRDRARSRCDFLAERRVTFPSAVEDASPAPPSSAPVSFSTAAISCSKSANSSSRSGSPIWLAPARSLSRFPSARALSIEWLQCFHLQFCKVTLLSLTAQGCDVLACPAPLARSLFISMNLLRTWMYQDAPRHTDVTTTAACGPDYVLSLESSICQRAEIQRDVSVSLTANASHASRNHFGSTQRAPPDRLKLLARGDRWRSTVFQVWSPPLLHACPMRPRLAPRRLKES